MKTSACGWPEPSTGIRLPRGQCSQSWISRVSWFSSRIARSRYFSRISSSVAGTWTGGLDGPPRFLFAASVVAASGARLAPAPGLAVRRRAASGVAFVWMNFSACT